METEENPVDAIQPENIQSDSDDNAPLVRNPVDYNPELLNEINDRVLALCRHGFMLANQRENQAEGEFMPRYIEFRQSVINHLKLVSISLYVYLGNALHDSKVRKKFTEFESETRLENAKIAEFLNKLTEPKSKDYVFTDSEFFQIAKLIMKRNNEEQGFLHPLYLNSAAG